MGIVNAGDDSFSDAVRLDTLERQVRRGLELAAEGADLVDVGGESGVTYTPAATADEEAARVVPLVERLVGRGRQRLGRHLEAGGGARGARGRRGHAQRRQRAARPRAGRAARRARARRSCVMHTRAEPKQRGASPTTTTWSPTSRPSCASASRWRARTACADEQLVLDPGPDFAKTPAGDRRGPARRSIACARSAARCCSRSRASTSSGRSPGARRPSGWPARWPRPAWAADAGAAILRVHDVAAVARRPRVKAVLDGRDEVPAFDAGDDELKWIRSPTR